MALGLKYWFAFKDEWDRYHCIQILKEGYSSTITELTKVSDPPVLLTKPSNGNKFQPIQGKEIALQLLSTTDMQFAEFFTATNRDYLIRYWIENSTNLLTNGNFTNWTGVPLDDTPDNWTIIGADDPPTRFVTEVSGQARIFGAASPLSIYIAQNILTSGQQYSVDADIISVTSGECGIGDSKFATAGHKRFTFLATDTWFPVGADDSEFIIDNVVCHGFDKIFEGYLVPDQYYEPFLAPAYAVTLRATDGLGDLKNRLFESAADTPHTGQDDLLDIIVKCLDQTGLALDIISACNFFETTHDKTDADDPLPQTFINEEVYRKDYITGWNCFDVLVDIMTLIGGKLEQINGAWHIIPIRELAGSAELITNGNFAAWTGDDPDSWTVTGEVTTDPEVSEVGSAEGHGGAGTGACNFYTTGNSIYMTQTILTIGKTYLVEIEVTKKISGSLNIFLGLGGSATVISDEGIYKFTKVCDGSDGRIIIGRLTACDITIDNVSVKQVSYDRRLFNSSGTYQSNDYINPQLTVSTPTTAEATLCCWSGGNQMLEIIPAWKEFILNQIYGYRENIIENGEFSKEFWSSNSVPLMWTLSASPTIARSQDSLRFGGVGNLWATNEKISQSVSFYDGVTQYLELEIDYIMRCPTANGCTFVIQVLLGGVPTLQYLTALGTWSVTPTTITIDTCPVSSEKSGTWKFVTDVLPAPSVAGSITLYISEPFAAVSGSQEIILNKVSMKIVGTSGYVYYNENEIKTSINSDYNYVPSDKNVRIGDLPLGVFLSDYELANWGGLLDSTGTGLLIWAHKGAADIATLLVHTAADIENNYDAPTYKLRGTIHSKVMDFNTVLKEGNLSDKIFIPGQMTYNPLRGIWTGEWLEIVTN